MAESRVKPSETAASRTPRSTAAWVEQVRRLRAQMAAEGWPLLDWDGVEREVRERRGGHQEADVR